MSTATLDRPAVGIAARPAVGIAARPARALAAVPTRPVPATAVAARTHLTRRGRVVLVLLGALVLLAAVSVGRTGSQAATAVDNGPALRQTTVQPGETLWAVAQRIAPKNDPRDVVEQIRRINHLPTSGLQAGQQLLLPVAG